MTSQPPLEIWATDYDTDAVQRATLADNALNAPARFDPPLVSRPEQRVSWGNNTLADDGRTLLSLRSNLDGVDAINVFRSGRQSTLVNSDANLEWWKITPELNSNQFGIFAYDSESNAYWIDGELSGNDILLETPRALPFTYYRQTSYFVLPYLSPDGKYIGHIQSSRTGDAGREFFIYSLEEEQFIWATPYDGDGLVNIIWGNEKHEYIAFVWGTTAPTAHQMTGVRASGETEPLIDLKTAYSDIVLSSALGVVAGSRYTPFWLDARSFQESRLVAYDHEANQLIDLCITTIATSILGTPDYEYVAFQIQNAIPTEYLIVEIATGDTYRLVADRTQILGISLDE